jgi:hypothetical protein
VLMLLACLFFIGGQKISCLCNDRIEVILNKKRMRNNSLKQVTNGIENLLELTLKNG